MANYPGAYYAPRAKENKSGVVYDADKKTIVFKEDFDSLEEEILAIEQDLGLNHANVDRYQDRGNVSGWDFTLTSTSFGSGWDFALTSTSFGSSFGFVLTSRGFNCGFGLTLTSRSFDLGVGSFTF